MTPVRLPYPVPSLGPGVTASPGRSVRAELIGRDHWGRDRHEPTGTARFSSTAGCRGVPATFPFPSRWGPSPLRAGAIHPGRKSPAPAGPSGWLDREPRSRRFPGGEPARVCPGDGARRDEAGGTAAGRALPSGGDPGWVRGTRIIARDGVNLTDWALYLPRVHVAHHLGPGLSTGTPITRDRRPPSGLVPQARPMGSPPPRGSLPEPESICSMEMSR